MRTTRTAIAALATAGALLAGGGAALAGEGPGQGSDKGSRCQRIVEGIAAKQGITVTALEAKLKQRALERINAALAADRITQDQANTLEAKVDAWKLCSGGGAKVRHATRLHAVALGSMIAGAVDYLDITRAQLREDLRTGKSLADIATAKGKSVPELKARMLEKITAKLNKAFSDGKLTAERRGALLDRYGKLADRLIAMTFKKPSST